MLIFSVASLITRRASVFLQRPVLQTNGKGAMTVMNFPAQPRRARMIVPTHFSTPEFLRVIFVLTRLVREETGAMSTSPLPADASLTFSLDADVLRRVVRLVAVASVTISSCSSWESLEALAAAERRVERRVAILCGPGFRATFRAFAHK